MTPKKIAEMFHNVTISHSLKEITHSMTLFCDCYTTNNTNEEIVLHNKYIYPYDTILCHVR